MPWTSTYSGRSVAACSRVWKASATRGLRRIRSSFFQAPTEVFTELTTPAARSSTAKLLTGRRTTPLAGVA